MKWVDCTSALYEKSYHYLERISAVQDKITDGSAEVVWVPRVDLPGGPLQIEWREADNRVYMTGPAELVFTGSVTL